MHCDDEELNLGTSTHLLVISWSQEADEDDGSICLTMVLLGVVGSLTGVISFKDT
jgi:putative effector of murein hydrolase